MSSYLSDGTRQRLYHFQSILSGITNLAFGRLLPSLRPYLPQSPTHLTNKNVIITGANSGIGLQIAKDLTHLGANVTLACRNLSRGQQAVDEILKLNPSAHDRVQLRQLDTSSLSSVREFAAKYIESTDTKLDILVNNAGMAMYPDDAASEYSPEGYEMMYVTNFLGPFLLTHLLEPHLATDARVIFTTSTGQFSGQFSSTFSPSTVKNDVELGFHAPNTSTVSRETNRYSMTKSMQCAFARSLQAKWENAAALNGTVNKRVAHCFTPSFTATPILAKNDVKSVFKEPLYALMQVGTVIATHISEGAATGTWLASTDDVQVVGEGVGGSYWDRMVKRMSTADLFGRDLLDRLWARWEADASIEWR